MSPDGLPNEAPTTSPVDAELRKDLIKALGSALPALLIVMVGDWFKLRVVSQPGAALWIIIPGLVFVSLFYVTKKTRQELRLGWPFLIFLSVYLLIFVVAAESRVLDWRRTLTGYETTTPSNFLALNRFGDWHYRFAPEKPNADLAVVLLKRPASVNESRIRIANLIDYARCSGAMGVALDIHFEETGIEGKKLNESLCQQIDPVKAGLELDEEGCNYTRDMPVFAGYDFNIIGRTSTRVPIDSSLRDCLPESRLGHAAVYREWDGKIRSVPQHLGTFTHLKSLGLVVAEHIARTSNQQIESPRNDLLQFTRPAGDLETIQWEDVWNHYDKGNSQEISSDRAKFQDRFILVGADKDQDPVNTPYGDKAGVVVHAYAVHSLRQNQFIRREGWWSSLLIIWLCCYLLMFFMARGTRTFRLIGINIAVSLFIIILAIPAMYFWLTWIDLVYPLLATWLFLLLLISLRRSGWMKARAAA
jgi:CHASE2 domain-containing sensor protein